MIRREEARQRRAINDYNNAARKYNAELRRAVQQEEKEARQAKQAVDSYNREARRHNQQVRANARRLASEIKQLERQQTPQRLVVVENSTLTLNTVFQEVEAAAAVEDWGSRSEMVVGLAEAETANSAAAANVLLGGASDDDEPIEETALTDELALISEDLDHRWRGALYAINPRNPDAARHFCTSSREIITRFLDLKAPDEAVVEAMPECDRTGDGRPVRRAKISFLLQRSSLSHESLGKFVDMDVDDVVGLFRVFNDGTHGAAGTLNVDALRALKGRVEGAIQFLSAITRRA